MLILTAALRTRSQSGQSTVLGSRRLVKHTQRTTVTQCSATGVCSRKEQGPIGPSQQLQKAGVTSSSRPPDVPGVRGQDPFYVEVECAPPPQTMVQSIEEKTQRPSWSCAIIPPCHALYFCDGGMVACLHQKLCASM